MLARRPTAARRAASARCPATAGWPGGRGRSRPGGPWRHSSLIAFSEEIDRPELVGGRADQRFARFAGRVLLHLAAGFADVGQQVLDLLLHLDHSTSHL